MMKEGSDQLEITELRLGQPGADNGLLGKKQNKRDFSEMSGCDEKKIEVVGWPPVCSYRKKKGLGHGANTADVSKMYVKVSMDGVPFLRKIDLNSHIGYKELNTGFHKLFSCKSKIPIYEDKDGDWMLVGDVPWQMFTESCKRLRIMKKSEDKGFEPCCRKTASRTGSSNNKGL